MREPAGVRGRHGLDGDDAWGASSGRVGLGAGGGGSWMPLRLRGAPEREQTAPPAGHLVAELSGTHLLAGAGRGARTGGRADGRPLSARVRQAVAQSARRRLARIHPRRAPQRGDAQRSPSRARRRHRTLAAARVLLRGAPGQRPRLQGRFPRACAATG